MAANATHGQVIVAAGAATAGDVSLGTIELPVRSEGWILHDVTAQVVRQTATAAECIAGHLRLNSVSGDITPDPAPSRWPVREAGSFLGAVADVSICPLHRYPLNLNAAGKANIELIGNLAIAATVAPIWAAGVAYGPSIPEATPFRFCDRVRATQATIARTLVGTINISEKATRILGIFGYIIRSGVITTAEEHIGFFDIDSDDVDLKPSQWLFNEAFGAGLGATIANIGGYHPMPHRVSIPVPGGARIDCYVTLETAITNASDVEIYIMYE